MKAYGYRAGSGGNGRFRGGNGLVREIELLATSQVTLLADRRKFPPYGLAGGDDGATGRAVLIKADGREIELKGKCTLYADAGDRIRVETPGGGGWGKAERKGTGHRRAEHEGQRDTRDSQ